MSPQRRRNGSPRATNLRCCRHPEPLCAHYCPANCCTLNACGQASGGRARAERTLVARSAVGRAEPPRVADRYVVKRLLGRGASGVVVAAEDVRLRRTVALKLGLAGADTSNLAEARALALRRSTIPTWFVSTMSERWTPRSMGPPFRLSLVCMQHVDGCTLRDWLHQESRSLREILAVFIAAGRGLAAAHASKLVHRDFKLDNVLIRTDGVAQVIDFGFALAARSTGWDGATCTATSQAPFHTWLPRRAWGR